MKTHIEIDGYEKKKMVWPIRDTLLDFSRKISTNNNSMRHITFVIQTKIQYTYVRELARSQNDAIELQANLSFPYMEDSNNNNNKKCRHWKLATVLQLIFIQTLFFFFLSIFRK